MNTRGRIILCVLLTAMPVAMAWAQAAPAAPTPLTPPTPVAGPASSMPSVGDVLSAVDKATAGRPGAPAKDWSAPVKLAVAFAFLALLPSVLIMMTSFLRIVIVLGFVRRALTTQSIPPTVAIVGLALFLSLFTMSPTLSRMNELALKPYLADKVTFEDAVDRGTGLLKEFMLRQTRTSDLALFGEMAHVAPAAGPADLPAHVVIPAFAVSEFRTAFTMGALLFIPFLLIDLVIAAILLAAGMMMLPPAMISLPFKIILFVLVDGWSLLAKTLVTSFQ